MISLETRIHICLLMMITVYMVPTFDLLESTLDLYMNSKHAIITDNVKPATRI